MRQLLAVFAVSTLTFASQSVAQDIKSGSRVTVTSEWHAQNGGPYSPKIVPCNSNSGLCLRDTSSSPANKPMTQTKSGLQVTFKDFGVIYLFQPGGKGSFHDMNGKKTGDFVWTQ